MRNFERVRPEDADAIDSMFEAARRTGQTNGTTDWDETYPTRAHIDEDIARGELWALREDGELLAVITMAAEELEEAADAGWTEEIPCCVLARLCVDPARQGRGIGAEVMRHITRQAARQGYRATRHLASVYNPAALRLYRKLGYRELKRVHCFDTDFIAFEMRIDPKDFA